MIQKIKNLIYHPFFTGSFVMVVGSNFANFIAYLYHVILGRMLGPGAYGELATTLSVLGIFSSLFTFLGLVIVKFISATKDKKLSGVFSWFTKRAFILAISLLIIGLILTPFMSSFLKIRKEIIILIGPTLFFFLLSFILKSYLQGLLKFGSIVIATNLEILARLLFGVVFVIWGYSSLGTVWGIFGGGIVGFLLSWYFLKKHKIFSFDTSFSGGKDVYLFAFPVLISTLASSSMVSVDLILVKHFFDPTSAGIYASLSTLGKIIFYGTGPISAVMFPLVVKRYSQGADYRKIFWLSLLLTTLVAMAVLLIYGLFPRFSIELLYGSRYLAASSNLIWYGIFITIYSLASLIVSFYLSIGSTKIVSLLMVAAILQGVGIWLFHDNLFSVIQVSIVSVSVLFVSLIIYMGYESKYVPK